MTDYNLYKIFLYLYEEKSISKTASKLYVSQPAISYSLKELESQLGYTLFYRNSKGIEPTTEASELYRYIKVAFQILTDAEEHIKNLNQLNVGCIRLGVLSDLSSFYLSSFISEFCKKYPGIQFQITCDEAEVLMEMLENRQLDFAFLTTDLCVRKSFEKVVLSSISFCLAYSNDAFVNGISLSELESYVLLLPDKRNSFRGKFEEYMENKKISFHSNIEVDDSSMMLEMVRKGIGVGYFIQEAIPKDLEGISIVSLPDIASLSVCCVYADAFLTVASRKFLEMVGEYYQNRKSD